ncbi:MAG: hypothetical protein Q7K28_01485 [Candidatus Wildermuthbacteria bacterium]|nr:hypothetical protein [Candidatus Wildermuthbacteria bacterium]
MFGNIKGKYGRYIERNRPRSFSEINIRGKELKRELDTGKVKSDPNLKKQKKYNVALIEKMRGE